MRYFLILLLFPWFISAQIVNVEDKKESVEKRFSGSVEFEFDYNKSTQIDLEFTNTAYLRWENDFWIVLLLNEIDLNRAGEEDFANDGFQHLRISYHLNNQYILESFVQNQHDLVHNIENRQLAGLGVRTKISKIGFIGISSFYEHEELVDNTINQDFRLSIYNQLSFNIVEKVKFSNVIYFQPQLECFSDYRLALEAAIVIPFSKNLSFANSFTLGYDSSPATDIPNINYQIQNSLQYNF